MPLLTTASPVSNICKSRNVWVTPARSHIFTVGNFSNSYVSHPLWKAVAFAFPQVALLSLVFWVNFECLSPPPVSVLVARQIHGGKREASRKGIFSLFSPSLIYGNCITSPLTFKLPHPDMCHGTSSLRNGISDVWGVAGTNRGMEVLVLYGIWDTPSPLST